MGSLIGTLINEAIVRRPLLGPLSRRLIGTRIKEALIGALVKTLIKTRLEETL